MPRAPKPPTAAQIDEQDEEVVNVKKLDVRTLKDIEETAPADLVRWLRVNQGMEVNAQASDEDVRMACAKILGIEFAPTVQVTRTSGAPKTKKVKILVYEGQENEPDYVFVNVQGRTAYIRRGIAVLVPEYLMPALQDAVQSDYTYDDTTNDLRKRDRHSYPYQVLGA